MAVAVTSLAVAGREMASGASENSLELFSNRPNESLIQKTPPCGCEERGKETTNHPLYPLRQTTSYFPLCISLRAMRLVLTAAGGALKPSWGEL